LFCRRGICEAENSTWNNDGFEITEVEKPEQLHVRDDSTLHFAELESRLPLGLEQSSLHFAL
jgi:hypothetical protein